jgi:hypothetical protein
VATRNGYSSKTEKTENYFREEASAAKPAQLAVREGQSQSDKEIGPLGQSQSQKDGIGSSV